MSPSTTKRTKVFISYSRGDDSLARELAKYLRAHRFDPFVDSENLALGENWALETGKALDEADAIVVLLSGDVRRATIADFEWAFALGSEKHAGRVLPVLTPGTPEDSVPWIVKRIPHIRASTSWEETSREVAAALRRMSGAA